MKEKHFVFHILPTNQLIDEISKYRSCSIPSFHRYCRELGIKHAGYRVRPRLYWVKDGERILEYLGFPGVKINVTKPLSPQFPLPPADTAAARLSLLSMPELKRERAKAKPAKKGQR